MKKTRILIFTVVYFLVLPITLFCTTTNQVINMKQSDSPIEAQAVHNMSRLKNYNTFVSHAPVKHAFFVSENRVEIAMTHFPEGEFEVLIKSYDYFSPVTQANNFTLREEFKANYTVESDIIVIEDERFDLTKNYVVIINGVKNNIYLSPAIGGILDTYFDASPINDLGLTYSGDKAQIKIWSPPAGRMDLLVFDNNEKLLESKKPLQFENTGQGIWHIDIRPQDFEGVRSLDGFYYLLHVYAYGQVKAALDPYALSMAAFDTTSTDRIGKAAIINMNAPQAMPANFKKTYSNAKHTANELDMIAYEVHVRDFTIQPEIVDDNIAGTFLGFIKKIDYLKSLGVTHVQLLPVNNFYTVNENDRAYKGSDAYPGNYNWGYDPHNYFTLEGWFSTDAKNPYARVREFRTLVQALHRNGIGLIMDVVYNHTYTVETFENVAPGCYYRYDDNLRISGTTGAGPSVESRRKMVRKLIVESLTHFVNAYNVDGFRFDLMGFHDHETMQDIREIVGKAYNADNYNELILQGEAWVFSDIDIDVNAKGVNAATTKINYPKERFNVAFFNDSSRDSYTGREQNKGFVQGDYKDFDRVASGIIGGLIGYDAGNSIVNTPTFTDAYNMFADRPATCLNYLTIHDGFTLWDKINLSVKDPSKEKRAQIMRLASAMLFTSQGKLILHGGDEILRTKPLAQFDKESDRAHTTQYADEEEGTLYFHENTYCSNDYTNMIRWDRLQNEYHDIATQMLQYYRGLISMRRHLPGLRYANASSVKNGLVFIGEQQQEMPKDLYKSFNDERLKQLKINFVNGPAWQRFYIAGEVYHKGLSANADNLDMYFVDFDGEGKASITFSKEQAAQFDLGKWGDGQHLNIKLVKTQGQWDVPENAYTGMGNNAITLEGINANGEVHIDLSVTDYVAGEILFQPPSYLAYRIDNTLENDFAVGFKNAGFLELIVIHNAGENTLVLETAYIENENKWVVILDGHNAGIVPLKYISEPTQTKGMTHVRIGKGSVSVPPISAAVIARIR